MRNNSQVKRYSRSRLITPVITDCGTEEVSSMLTGYFLARLLLDHQPEIRSGHCLRAMYPTSNCRVCLEHCPHAAIDLQKEPAITAAKCTGCGLCGAACPTGVFQQGNLDPAALFKKITDYPQALIYCSIQAETRGTLQVPCLAALNDELLLALGLANRGLIGLNTAHCEHCSLSDQMTLIELRVNKANQNFRVLFPGASHCLELLKTKDEVAAILSNNLLPRRQLFSLIKKKASSLMADFIINQEGEPSRSKHRKFLPPVREALLRLLAQLQVDGMMPGSNQESLAPIKEVQAACNGCGLCAILCPTGALQQQLGEQTVSLSYHPERCVSCHLCVAACPQAAMAPAGPKMVTTLLERSEVLLVVHQLATCPACHHQFIPGDDRELCIDCSKQKELEAELGNWLRAERRQAGITG